MKFHVIYIEDDPEARRRLKDAVGHYNKDAGTVELDLKLTKTLDELRNVLTQSVDLVLADVFLQDRDCLTEIVEAVTAWSLSNKLSPIPVIAYTGRGEAVLQSCLRRKDKLLDIWDKDSASPSYVTWRLSNLANELSRLRPDTYMQRLIREMPNGASWHKFVTKMPNSYAIALTEMGQIESISGDIENIAHNLQVWNDPCQEIWKVMIDWETLGRAVSRRTRGHARHVVNVFWLGYYLIHHEVLRDWFGKCWQNALKARVNRLENVMKSSGCPVVYQRLGALQDLASEIARSGDSLESLSNAWFFAALFHDVGACVQKYVELRQASDNLIKKFDGNITSVTTNWFPDDYTTASDELFAELDDHTAKELQPLWQKSLSSGQPDHGVVAALLFRKRFHSHQRGCAFEAALAMASHNLIGELNPRIDRLLTWDNEPLICLLVLCDQIQTWDRERGDEDIFGPDYPARAQLTSVEITPGVPKPRIRMDVDYLVPHHVEHSTVLFERVTRQLERVIKDKPSRALARISPEWPFELDVKCSLSGRPLGTDFSFGRF